MKPFQLHWMLNWFNNLLEGHPKQYLKQAV